MLRRPPRRSLSRLARVAPSDWRLAKARYELALAVNEQASQADAEVVPVGVEFSVTADPGLDGYTVTGVTASSNGV